DSRESRGGFERRRGPSLLPRPDRPLQNSALYRGGGGVSHDGYWQGTEIQAPGNGDCTLWSAEGGRGGDGLGQRTEKRGGQSWESQPEPWWRRPPLLALDPQARPSASCR